MGRTQVVLSRPLIMPSAPSSSLIPLEASASAASGAGRQGQFAVIFNTWKLWAEAHLELAFEQRDWKLPAVGFVSSSLSWEVSQASI